MIAGNPRNYATFGIINGRHKVAGAVFEAPSGVAKRHWRSMAMGSYTQLSFTEQLKTCSWCGETKPLTEFHRSRDSRDGRKAHCKTCGCLDANAYRSQHRDEVNRRRRIRVAENPAPYREQKRAWNEAHREEIRAQDRERARRNPERNRQRAQEWYYANRERALETRHRYAEAHREEKRQADRAYREANAERLREYKKLAYHRDKEKYAEQRQAYRDSRRELTRRKAREYYRKHPEKVRYHVYQRKARMRGAADAATVAWANMVRKDPCAYCGKAGGTIDHIVPVSKGGLHEVGNLTGACLDCNIRKMTASALTFLYRTNRRSEG